MRKLVVGNWKSHKSLAEAQEFVDVLDVHLGADAAGWEAWIAPPAPYLALLARQSARSGTLRWVAQNVSAHAAGAHTGEFTAEMLVSCGIHAALVGHSERRERFGDVDDVVRSKVVRCLEAGVLPILCCGETRVEREAGQAFARVEAQIQHALSGLAGSDPVVVAYEPVWAIGTGLTASAAQAEDMHAHLESVLAALGAAGTQILYGGSVNPGNVRELFEEPHVHGALVGGASLDPASFAQLVRAGA